MLGEAQWFAQVTPLSGTREDEGTQSYSRVNALNSLKVLPYKANFPLIYLIHYMLILENRVCKMPFQMNK